MNAFSDLTIDFAYFIAAMVGVWYTVFNYPMTVFALGSIAAMLSSLVELSRKADSVDGMVWMAVAVACAWISFGCRDAKVPRENSSAN